MDTTKYFSTTVARIKASQWGHTIERTSTLALLGPTEITTTTVKSMILTKKKLK